MISVDAMGGDHGVSVIVDGLQKASLRHQNLEFLIHGNKNHILEHLEKKPKLHAISTIVNCRTTIEMEEKPSVAIRNGKDSSMWSALAELSNGKANIAVSCGNTGALMAMAMLQLRKAPGINRPAIAVLWPARNSRGFNIVLDAGADIKADADDLLQYALMGVAYARDGFDIQKPKVGLLNVGTEIHKGRNELHEASLNIAANQKSNGFEFVGYLEGSDIPSGKADVIVTDGFTGNVALKTGEGTASLIRELLKESLSQSIASRLGAVLSISSLKQLNKKIDPRNVNGGIFLGLNGIVIKSHGGADAIGVAAAINLAHQLEILGFSRKLTSKFNRYS